MCNVLHRNGSEKPIPSCGIGYKIFKLIIEDNALALKPLVNGTLYQYTEQDVIKVKSYTYPIKTWVKFNDAEYIKYHKVLVTRKQLPDAGFCFFLTLEEAYACLKRWFVSVNADVIDTVICKIEYRNGIGSCVEEGMFSHYPIRMAFAKTFQIVNIDKNLDNRKT